MIEDLPVLGYPINPTEICFLSVCSCENCLRSCIREPFPKELVIDAWNAKVGRSLERCLTQAACLIGKLLVLLSCFNGNLAMPVAFLLLSECEVLYYEQLY